jgi:hypothetical protein
LIARQFGIGAPSTLTRHSAGPPFTIVAGGVAHAFIPIFADFESGGDREGRGGSPAP